MGQTLFTNVKIFDGNSKRSYAGEVLLQGNLVKKVAKGQRKIRANGAEVIDGAGAALMPGLVESHSHVCYTDCVTLKDIGRVPVEEHMVIALENARLMLDHGFTSLFSAAGVGSPKLRIEPVLRDVINAGRFPGPRIKAASPEITSTGGLGDERQLHMYHESVGYIADGPDEVRRAARVCVREGVDVLKINISGDEFAHQGQSEKLTYTDAEVAAAVEVGREAGVHIACHARADRAVRMALKHGITTEVAEGMNLFRKMENTARVYHEVRKRGIRALPGGDYGFAWTPIGANARDLEHFVNLFGYSPGEALIAATKWGGELMEMNLGQIKEGYLADLLLVNGDPTQDVSILQDRDNLIAIMKDGSFHKAPDADVLTARRQIAAPAAAE